MEWDAKDQTLRHAPRAVPGLPLGTSHRPWIGTDEGIEGSEKNSTLKAWMEESRIPMVADVRSSTFSSGARHFSLPWLGGIDQDIPHWTLLQYDGFHRPINQYVSTSPRPFDPGHCATPKVARRWTTSPSVAVKMLQEGQSSFRYRGMASCDAFPRE